MIKPVIKWEKWIDPFGGNFAEAKWTDYNNTMPEYLADSEEDLIEDSYDEEANVLDSPIAKSNEEPIKVIASPLGLIPYNEYTASSKIFNFWLGHSNFDISSKIKNVIEQTKGVEILDVFTRYRFRIAIGKCFNDAEVMSEINNNVYNSI